MQGVSVQQLRIGENYQLAAGKGLRRNSQEEASPLSAVEKGRGRARSTPGGARGRGAAKCDAALFQSRGEGAGGAPSRNMPSSLRKKKPCGAAGAAGPAVTYRLPSPAAMHSRRAAAILAPRGRSPQQRPLAAAPEKSSGHERGARGGTGSGTPGPARAAAGSGPDCHTYTAVKSPRWGMATPAGPWAALSRKEFSQFPA